MDEDLKAEVFSYLDDLRTSGEVNMFGATPCIMQDFGMGKTEARKFHGEWMRTFAERHPHGESTS